jgi:thiol-disulfide isomerase/thioredoxin
MLFEARRAITVRPRVAFVGSVLAIACCVFGCGGAADPKAPGGSSIPTEHHTSPTTEQKSEQPTSKIEFTVFSARWCGVCREVPAVFEKLRATFPKVAFRDLDIDVEENQKRWVEYGSDAVPYNYILIDGKVVAKFRGFLPHAMAEKFLRDTLDELESPSKR